MTTPKKLTELECTFRRAVGLYLHQLHHEVNTLHMRLLRIEPGDAWYYFRREDEKFVRWFERRYPKFVELENKLCKINNACLDHLVVVIRAEIDQLPDHDEDEPPPLSAKSQEPQPPSTLN